MRRKGDGMTGVPIVAYDENGEPRGRFDDPATAVKSGINSGNLYQGLKNGKIVNGFKWMKEEDFIPLYFTEREKLKWKRDSNHIYGNGVKGKRGFAKGHFGFDTWKNGNNDEERKLKCKNSCKAMHKANDRLRMSGEFIGNSKKVMNMETGDIYKTMSDAAKAIGRSLPSLSEACRLFHKCAGYHWKLI